MGSEKESENGELPDLEKQQLGGGGGGEDEASLLPNLTTVDAVPPLEQVVVSGGASSEVHEPPTATAAVNFSEEFPSPKKDHLSRTSSSHEQCKQASYWVWKVDSSYRSQNRDRGCVSPPYVVFSILIIGGLMLDVLMSVTLGVSALPTNIIIGIIVVLGLGTALRLALEFLHESSLRRAVQRVDASHKCHTNVPLGYPPALYVIVHYVLFI